jgi:hypothetical protein
MNLLKSLIKLVTFEIPANGLDETDSEFLKQAIFNQAMVELFLFIRAE